jgi:hypothetical protein
MPLWKWYQTIEAQVATLRAAGAERVAPTSRPAGALSGIYGGASAEATVGAGVGANVMVGGSNRTIQLQPLSLQGQTGLNVAAGVSGIELRWVRRRSAGSSHRS